MVKSVALLCVFGVGMCFSLLGSISVKLMPRLKIDKGKFGSLISAFMFTSLVASLIMGVVTDKIGYKPVAAFGFVATSACIFMLAYGKTYQMVIVPFLLLGFGASALSTAGNTLIPVVLFGGENHAAASNFGHVFFGIGLLITPLLVSFLFKKTTYEKAISVLAVIVLIPVLFALIAKDYPEVTAGFTIGQAFALLKEPVVLIAAVVLFCYMSLETSFCNWLAPYTKEVAGRDLSGLEDSVVDAISQQMLSVFAIAMMAGRLISSQIGNITEYGGMYIAGAALVSGLVILAMGKTGAIWTSALAACAGFFFGPCFPTVVGVMKSKHPENFGSVFGIIFAVGMFGGMIIPKTIGNLSKGSMIQKSLKLLIPICVVMLILALILGRVGGGST